jgi:type 1 glutamine amidotransferase
MLNNTTQLKLPDAGKKQALLDFVHDGKGLVGIHAATDSFYDWPEGAALLGGLFDGHPWGAGGTWAFKLDEPAHPLNRAWGGKGFKLQDEIYQFKAPYTRADRRVLVSLDLSDPATGGVKDGVKRTDQDFAVAWIKAQGQGRVFYCSLGHAANVFQEPAVLRFYLDGIQFAAGDLSADASPR